MGPAILPTRVLEEPILNVGSIELPEKHADNVDFLKLAKAEFVSSLGPAREGHIEELPLDVYRLANLSNNPAGFPFPQQ
jgi:hypothetical protein